MTSTAAKPPLVNKETDFGLPRRLFTAWIPNTGPREIRRAMTTGERSLVEARAAELRAGLSSFLPGEEATVNAHLAGMLGGFRFPVSQGAIHILRGVLREFPLWAIVQACNDVATNQIPMDRDSAPSDRKMHEVVTGIVANYRSTLRVVEALLAAPVEASSPPAYEGPYSGPAHDATARKFIPASELGDGKHAERVAADLAARKSRQQTSSAA